jgi:hypothetical protein
MFSMVHRRTIIHLKRSRNIRLRAAYGDFIRVDPCGLKEFELTHFGFFFEAHLRLRSQ